MFDLPQIEEKILKFWEENKIFGKSLEKDSPNGDYIFYDGPPFATGLPHYGHILSSVIKDVVPRYWTMKGYRVPRRWGWDCHGMPNENLIEKKLKVSGKKDIEDKIGVDKFNKACRDDVLMYAREWKKMVDRMGRWVEFDNAYKTMDSTYMESVWWALKTIWDKGLVYEGRKVLMYCPRCETPVSKAEIAMDNSYKDIVEESATVKFKLKKEEIKKLEIEKLGGSEDVYILAWTTTPWTLPANVALAVGSEIDYVLIRYFDDRLKVYNNVILAKVVYEKWEKEDVGSGDIIFNWSEDSGNPEQTKIIKEFKGTDLVGLEYEPLIDIPAIRETGKKAWYVTDADFVTTEEGTGIVHTAVVYGEDDYNLGLKKDLPVVPLLDEKGYFNNQSPELIRGQYFKDAEKDIKQYLKDKDLLFKLENYQHAYPHCWRCDTQLFYNAISAWFINVQKVKDRLIELNEKINWYPDHLKHGRFLNILETAPDWNISRNRYWATPLPFWKCDNRECDHVECIGSVKELEEKATNFDKVYNSNKIEEMDLHKHVADKIKLKCTKCGKEMTRIPEVIDCWVESASMPFAEHHYPFENEETFKRRYPGQYIAEYIAQTRAWFYYMHVMATLLFDDISFENCVTTGTILNDKGEKLSKSKMNYTDPWEIINKYGMDSLRYYLMTSVVMQADNLFFNDGEVKEVYNKVINPLVNVLTFYKMFTGEMEIECLEDTDLNNILDVWINSKLEVLKKEVTEQMDNYNTVKAGRPIRDFIGDLSTWYVRRSRDRFKGEDQENKIKALKTLRHVLFNLSKIMAPFMPFISEHVYKELGGVGDSVHLRPWPEYKEEWIDQGVLDYMEATRKIVELGLAKRSEAGIKVRQPLKQLTINNKQLTKEYLDLIKDEVNARDVVCVKSSESSKIDSEGASEGQGDLSVELDTEITDELKEEGTLRELVRTINNIRKKQGLTINDHVGMKYSCSDEHIVGAIKKFEKDLKRQILADSIEKIEGGDLQVVKVNGADVGFGLEIINHE